VLNVTADVPARQFVGFRLASGALTKVDDLAKQRGTDRSEALRYLLVRGWRAHEAAPETAPDVKRDAPGVKSPPPPADDFAARHAKLNRHKQGRS
jgi:hypothetical protein